MRDPSRWLTNFILLVCIWGFSFFFIKVGDASFAPLQVAAGRMLFGLVLLLILLAARKDRLPRGWTLWAKLAIAGTLLFAVPFSLFAYGEQHVSSVLAGIWNATTPVMVAAFGFVWSSRERLTWMRVGGILTGFVGVLVVLGAWAGVRGGDLSGSAMCLGATACYGLGNPFVSRYLARERDSLVALSAGQLLVASMEVVAVAVLFTRSPARIQVDSIVSVLLLGTLGTGLAGVLRHSIIVEAGPITASLVTYLIPVVSTCAGVFLLGEPIRWNLALGAGIILVGCVGTQDQIRAWIVKRMRVVPDPPS